MTAINVTELDFQTIKESIKTFLQSQDKFQDYDFEGAGLTVLLDILSYFTHYNGIYANLAFNEMFLDSAQLRNSIVSRAKELGFTPRSATAAKATIRVSWTQVAGPNPATIEKGTKFITTLDGQTYIFVTADVYNVVPVANVYTADIDIYEGQFVSETYTANLADPTVRYVINNSNVDTSFLTVNVKFNANAGSSTVYTEAGSIVSLTDSSEIYFLEMNENGLYEARFGDGVIGKAIETSNVITLAYLITSGSIINGATVFSPVAAVGGASNVTITNLEPAGLGTDAQEIDDIKLLAPKSYQLQGRAVTKDDYSALLLSNYSNIDSVSVWGGEDNVPPYYGKVFIAINPVEDIIFSNAVKDEIKAFILDNYNILAIRPEIVDPEFLYVEIHTTIKYDFRKTDLTVGDIETGVKAAISSFFDANLNSFNKTLEYSKLIGAIDNAYTFIRSNLTTLKFQIRKNLTLNIATTYNIEFSNAVSPGSITSDEFYIDGIAYRIDDSPSGTLPYSTGIIRVYRTVNNVKIFQNTSLGTVNYVTGSIVLNQFKPTGIVTPGEAFIRIHAQPAQVGTVDVIATDYNVFTNSRNQLLTLDNDNVAITLTAVKD